MLADAFPERAAPAPDHRRRAGMAALALLLHAVLLYGLLHAINVRAVQKVVAQVPVTIWFPLTPPKKEPDKKKPEPEAAPQTPAAQEPKTAPITIPRSVLVRPHSDEDGIGKLGRYLDNCSAGNYERLSPQEWANCLGGMATRDHNGNTIKLGDVRTLWEMQHKPPPQPDAKQATGFGECAHDDPRRLQGLPCFQHNGDAPTISNGRQ